MILALSNKTNFSLFARQPLLKDYLVERQLRFFSYLSLMDSPGQKTDQFTPYLMSRMLGRKISIYNGAYLWHSDDIGAMDIVLGNIEHNFFATKVGNTFFNTFRNMYIRLNGLFSVNTNLQLPNFHTLLIVFFSLFRRGLPNINQFE